MSNDIIRTEYVKNDLNSVRHSDEIRDIISTAPSKLLRMGMMLFAGIFVIIVGMTCLIHFPNILKTTLSVTDAEHGVIDVSQIDFQKVHVGEQVIIHFRSYPFEKFGFIEGKITSIGTLPGKNDSISASVALTIHYLKKNSKLTRGVLADAQIITEDVTILKRISSEISFSHEMMNTK